MNNPKDTNQASEDDPIKSKVDWSTPYNKWLIPILNRFRYGGAIECRAIPSEIQLNIEAIIRTEKLKLLAEVREEALSGGLSFELDDGQIVIEVETDLKSITTKLEAEL